MVETLQGRWSEEWPSPAAFTKQPGAPGRTGTGEGARGAVAEAGSSGAGSQQQHCSSCQIGRHWARSDRMTRFHDQFEARHIRHEEQGAVARIDERAGVIERAGDGRGPRKQLMEAKTDQAYWSSVAPLQLLRADYKAYRSGAVRQLLPSPRLPRGTWLVCILVPRQACWGRGATRGAWCGRGHWRTPPRKRATWHRTAVTAS